MNQVICEETKSELSDTCTDKHTLFWGMILHDLYYWHEVDVYYKKLKSQKFIT